jgi:hypothetical protein
MTIGKLLTKNGQTMVVRQGHGFDSMDTSFPGPRIPAGRNEKREGTPLSEQQHDVLAAQTDAILHAFPPSCPLVEATLAGLFDHRVVGMAQIMHNLEAMFAHYNKMEADNEGYFQDYDLCSYETAETISKRKTAVAGGPVEGQQLALL